MPITYNELRLFCGLPKQNSAAQRAVVRERACDIESLLAEEIMGATLYDEWWLFGDPAAVFAPPRLGCRSTAAMHDPNDEYHPLHRADQSLAAMDKMIERGWAFAPAWGGTDFSAVEAYNFQKDLHVRSLYWSDEPQRHATALTLAIALAFTLEVKLSVILSDAQEQIVCPLD